ncbi:MAG: NAD(P)H-hydrate epimerase [Chloroflexi bacterium]|nr:NAD(P)H-hydrate epimerase [Chloroflexota bacterium]
MTPPLPTASIVEMPALTVEQMRDVDRRMVEEFSITLPQMMENAARNLADLVQHMLGGLVMDRPILVLAGRGANGGGGLAAARHLANRGAEVQALIAHPFDAFSGVSAQQLDALLAMGVSVSTPDSGWELPDAELVVDALIGYGLRGEPQFISANLIRLANSHPAPILALDAPSGLDAASGRICEPCIRAAATLALALPKTGLIKAPRGVVGDIYLADIGVPPVLYEDMGLEPPPIFSHAPLLRLTRS